MPYLPDSSAVITPFHDGVLGTLRVGLNHSSLKETQAWLRDWFTRGFSNGHLVGSEDLLDEVGRKKSPASLLLKSLQNQIRILLPTPDTFSYVADIEQFVRDHFEPHQADAFLKKADPMFIALAKTHEVTLVTAERHDIPQYNGKAKCIKGEPRIPFVAWVFGVRCITLYQALQEVP